MRVLAILLLLPCALVQAQESGAQADQVPDFISYFQGPDNGTASSTVAATNAILQKQQMSRVLSNLVLELHSATAFNSFASQLFALTADAPNSELLIKPAPINRPYGFEEEDEDEQPRSLEEEEDNAFENLMASLYGPTYLNTLKSPYVAENPYYKAQVDAMNNLKDLGRQGRADLFEDGLETALAYVLKLSQIENINKLDQAQVSHSQNSLALVILSGSQYASNPLAIQMMYLLKFKMFLDNAGSSASIVRQDAWTMWNYNEMIETRLDSIPNDFQKIISTYKSTAMNSWLMEAQIDLMNLYLDYYIQTITGALTGSMGSGSAGSAGSVPQNEAQNSTGNAFLELEEMSQQSSSIANPQAILYYASYFRILLRINNYVAAQSNALESQLEYYISYGEVNDAEKLKSSADMLKFVHTQAVYSFRSLGYLRLTLASLDMTLFTLAGGLSGSLAGSLGGSMYPATSLGNSFGGSLGAAAGSLGLAAGSLGAATSSLGPVAGLAGLGSMGGYGSLALSALAGSSVGGSLASKAAMHMLHNLIQEDAKAEENLNTDPVAEPVAEAVAPQTAAPVQAPAVPAPAPAVAAAPAPVAAAPAVSAPAPKAPAAQPVVENKSLLTEAPIPAVKEAFPAIESEYKSLVG